MWKMHPVVRFLKSEKARNLGIALAAAVLGNLLSFLSSQLTPLNPQVTFDFSHLATFAIAITFGPWYGLLTAALSSLYPYFHLAVFGIYGPVFGLAIIFGKSMTGFFCGLLRGRMPTFLAITLSYIPESIFTFLFLHWMSSVLPPGTLTWDTITVGVIAEGWVEVIMFSFIIDNMVRRRVVETAVLMLEIFIIMFLVHKEFLETLLLLLLIALFTLILFELVEKTIHKPRSRLPENKDREQ
ncbi:MAG: ECF transporter S component [Dehalococcoidia bacterium]|nr:ECF transporter S component [Dehalococcoidia bacterium]